MVESRSVLVTGGAGFIGSHLVDALLREGHEVRVLDDLSAGHREVVPDAADLVKDDCRDRQAVARATKGCDAVFHLAANPDVRASVSDPVAQFEHNVQATHAVAEASRAEAAEVFFASSSVVYGNATVLPTPEDHGPLVPVSTYGAAKLASEALLAGHANAYDLPVLIHRFANIVGPRSTHGVIVDFVRKLRKDPTRLEILGDGQQRKSYCHVADVVDAIVHTWTLDVRPRPVAVYNVATGSTSSVDRIAELVADVLGLETVQFDHTGAAPGGGGWKGDVPTSQLDIKRLRATGWDPKHTSDEAVRAAASWCADHAPS